MKALRTKVILSGIVLVFAFIATIGTTFAWFTVSSTVTVDTMTINVTSADSLLILPKDNTGTNTYVATGEGNTGTEIDLLDTANYETLINATDLVDYGYEVGNTPGTSWRLSPVTIIDTDYAGGYDATTLSAIDSNNFSTRDLVAAVENDENGDYIKLEFWVLLQGEDGSNGVVELTSDSSITSIDDNTGLQDEVANAVRLSIWADDTTFGGGSAQSPYIFGNDLDYDFIFNAPFDNAGYDTLDDTDLGNGNYSTLTTTITETDHISFADNATAVNPQDIFTLQYNVPTLITVLIYVEGWDEDASDNIALAGFEINFGFEVGEVGFTQS
jgi:hypothetical protein